MRRRQLKWLWKRLRQIATMEISREELLMKLGGARSKAPAAWRLVDVEIDKERPSFTFVLNRKKLRTARRREGRYLLRTNLTENDPAQLWQYYTQLVAVEEAFRNLKGDLAIRPVFHHDEKRIEAHIFIAFLAYCMQITLTRRLHALAPGLTGPPRSELRRHVPNQGEQRMCYAVRKTLTRLHARRQRKPAGSPHEPNLVWWRMKWPISKPTPRPCRR
jgi:hypothetical protein